MLMLSRKRDEAILITDDSGLKIRILITRTSKSVVQLGIEAPTSIKIMREEIVDQSQEN